MRIGFLLDDSASRSHIGLPSGLSIAFMDQGHECFIYSDRLVSGVKEAALDCLIWVGPSDDHAVQVFRDSKATLKGVCMTGFDPSSADGDQFVSPLHDELIKDFWMLADGQWQLRYISRFTDNYHTHGLGGVNTEMFKPVPDAPIFVDTTAHGGFNSHVLEAFACAKAVVCVDAECNSSFAIHDINCLTVPPGDGVGMQAAVDRLMKDRHLREDLSISALRMAQSLTYDKAADRLRFAILERLKQ